MTRSQGKMEPGVKLSRELTSNNVEFYALIFTKQTKILFILLLQDYKLSNGVTVAGGVELERNMLKNGSKILALIHQKHLLIYHTPAMVNGPALV